MKIILGLVGLLLLLVIAFFFTQTSLFAKKASATIHTHTFTIDVAKTPKDKEIGLASKNTISADYGMYFPFEKSDYYAFWMKNMKFPIDIIFLKDNKIVTIFSNVPNPASSSDNLPLYQPSDPANAVLEITAGLSDKYGFTKGDTVTFKNLPK